MLDEQNKDMINKILQKQFLNTKKTLFLITVIILFTNHNIFAVELDSDKTQEENINHFFKKEKDRLFHQLSLINKKLPDKVFGMSSSEFEKAKGKIGFVQTNLTLDFNEVPYMEVPTVGKKITLIFKNIELIGNNTIKLYDNLARIEAGYKITAYKLETCFLDSSKYFYQFYYKIKYELINNTPIGKWNLNDGEMHFEYFEDGSFKSTSPSGEKHEGTWSQDKNGTIEVFFIQKDKGQVIPMEGVLKEDKLILNAGEISYTLE